MKKLILILLLAVSCNPVFAQFFGGVSQSILGTEYNTKTFNLNQNVTDSLLLFVQSGSRNILIDTASASGVTLQSNIEQLSSSNRWATNLGDWTTSGDMSATRESDASVTLDNIPVELNPNLNFANWAYVDLLAGWDLTSGWTNGIPGATTIINNNSFVTNAYGGVYKNVSPTFNVPYKLDIVANTTATQFRIITTAGVVSPNPIMLATTTGAINYSGVFLWGGSSSTFFLNNQTAGTTDITSISLAQLVAPTGWTSPTMDANNYVIQDAHGIKFVEGTGTTSISLSGLTSGATYRVINNLYSRTSGELNVYNGSTETAFSTTLGLDTVVVTLSGTTLTLQVDNNSNLVSSMISVIRVYDASEFTLSNQTTEENKNYKFCFEAKSSLSSKKVFCSYGNATDSLSLTSSYQTVNKEFWGIGEETIKFWASENTTLSVKDISLEEITTKKVVVKGDTTKVYFTPNTTSVGNKTASITLNNNKTIDFNYDVVYSNKAYYVSNSGNDANDGLSEATAWKTLEKVEDFDVNVGFDAGDKILFDATSTFNYANFKLTSSGSAVAPIELNTYNGIYATFNSGLALTDYTVKETPSSVTLDTSAQNLTNASKTSIAGEYYTGYKVTFTAGKLTKYFALSSETSPVKSQVKLYTSSDGVNFSVVTNSESVVLESTVNGINTYNLKTPLDVTAGDYWIVLVANASRYIPYQANTTGTNNYFFYNYYNAWNAGEAEATYLSSIANPTLRHLPDVAVGAEIQTTTAGLSGTIYKVVAQNVKEVRLNGGQGVLGTLVNYADLNNENEYAIINDSIFVFNDIENNVAIIKGHGLKIEGDNYLIKNLYFKQNDSALVMSGNNIDIDSVYFLNNKYAFVNNGNNKIRQSKFVQNRTAVSNDSMDIYTNWFINSGLVGSSTLNFTSGNSKVIHNSFYTTVDGGKAFIENSGGLYQLLNNAFQSSTNDYMIYTSEAIEEANANAYAGNRTYYLNGTTYSSGTEWSVHNPENNIVLIDDFNYTDLYDLNVSDNTTDLIDAGIETDIKVDIHGNPFPYDPTGMGYGNEDIGASEYQGKWQEPEVTPPTTGRVIYVRANGSNDYATYATNSVTGVTIDALKNNINNEADGVTVLFQKGNKFRVSDLYIHDVNNITIGAYGSGAKPIIEIRDTLKGVKNSANWSLYAPNVYRFSLIPSGNAQISGVSRMWIDGQEYESSITSSIVPEANTEMAIGEKFRWKYYSSSSSIMVWTPPGQMPYDVYSSITLSSDNRSYGFRINNCDNVTIDGLQINASMQGGIWLGGTGSDPVKNTGVVTDVEIKNCTILYGYQAGLVARGDGVDRLNIHDNIIDKKTDETYGGIRVHEMHHVVDLQWGCDNIELHHNEIKGAGISSIRLVGALGSGYSENIKIYNNYVWSSAAWCRPFSFTVAPGGTNEDRAKNVDVFNNYFENMRTRNQSTGIDIKVYYNIFDSTLAYQDVKVLHHLGQTSEDYEISDNDQGYWETSDETSIKSNDIYFFNNTMFVAGHEFFSTSRQTDGDDRKYICNNAFINSGQANAVSWTVDAKFLSGTLYTINNNYSWNNKRPDTAKAVILSIPYTWEQINDATFTYADFNNNYQHGTADYANYNLLFNDPEHNNFNVKSSNTMYRGGWMNQTLLNILGANFKDRYGNQVTNSSGALIKPVNIGAVNN